MEKYKDPSAHVTERVADLLSRMTLEEKCGQLNQFLYGWKAYQKIGGKFELTEDFKKAVTEKGMGAMYGLFRADPWSGMTWQNGLAPEDSAIMANQLQEFVIKNTRLGIPMLLAEETPHGHQALGATVFPVSTMLSSTWDTELMKRVGHAWGTEIRARGAHVGYGPVLDIVQDNRWSRIEESFGEDPHLTGQMGAAIVRGMQGESLNAEDTVASTLKHFTGQGCSEGGHNTGPAHMGEREMREIFLEGFREPVKAGVTSLMAAYNEIDGIPCHANRKLLTEILREEWGFEGFVVSDGSGVDNILHMHHIAENLEDAGALAIKAGVDICLWDQAFGFLVSAVKNGRLTEAQIDQAVGRVLRTKFMLGLFEKPYHDVKRASQVIHSDAHRSLARETAGKGIILLKNKDGILPLKKSPGKIAVIGPNADNIYNQLGDYTAPQIPENVVTVLQGIRNAVSSGTIVEYAWGCGIRDRSTSGFKEAIALAERSDIIIAVVGGSSARDFGVKFSHTGAAVVDANSISDMDSGEGFDRSEISLGGAQEELLKELKKTGKPLIVILIQGRLHGIPWVKENADALLCAWYPGEQGGNAIADVLFGEENPSGKLPLSWPRSSAASPTYYNHKAKAREKYIDMDNLLLYPFGFGLSYTNFEYSNLKIEPKEISPDQKCSVSIQIKNIGKTQGEEVVQLYLRDQQASVTRPVKELKGFKKIALKPQESATVNFELGPDELRIFASDGKYRVEPGLFTVMVGKNSEETLEGELRVT